MCVLFVLNLLPNTGHLMYNMVDYYQVLFILLFLNADYPPNLNYFFNGFRYSHYLFLPQIFRAADTTLTMSQHTPIKFGILVPDANFLTNTGHNFLIMFVLIAVFVLLKLIDFCARGSAVDNLNNI